MKLERRCGWCQSPLETTDTDFTCDRCDKWRQGISKASSTLTESELRELEEYSRFIYTRPLTSLEREVEENGRVVNRTRR